MTERKQGVVKGVILGPHAVKKMEANTAKGVTLGKIALQGKKKQIRLSLTKQRGK